MLVALITMLSFGIMQSPTDRWYGWMEADDVSTSHPLKFVERVILPALRSDGFAVPVTRLLVGTLTAGLEPLPVVRTSPMCSFVHFLNLLWQPLIDNIDDLANDPPCMLSAKLKNNEAAILMEMKGIVSSADVVLTLDSWIEFIRDTLLKVVGMNVPTRLIIEVVSPVAPLKLATTPANAMHLLRSSLCSKLVGPALAAQANRLILAHIAELPVVTFSQEDLGLKIKDDLAASLAELHCGPDLHCGPVYDKPLKKQRRDHTSAVESLGHKTKQVLFMLENRLASSRVQETLTSASRLIDDMRGTSSSSSDPPPQDLQDLLHHRTNLSRHLLTLDGAIDKHSSEMLFQARQEGRFAGVALATDESPPSQPRFSGLRFQITVVYCGSFAPLADWESFSDPPIIVHSLLGDIMHCPGKKGVDVSRIIEKQLTRVGLNSFDVVSCTGDGGGENEGLTGVHAYFENLCPGYVRRRCLPHIAWRTMDMAMQSSGLDYKKLAAYLVEGVTWSRLREIAIKDPRHGGLKLLKDGSEACKKIFGRAPCAIVGTRPETDLKFLKLLRGKEHVLHELASKDLEQRSLSAESRLAVLNLGDINLRICRAILGEILERCMFLHYWNGKHAFVATTTSWDELLGRAASIILDLEITPEVLKKFGTTEYELRTLEPRTWVELVVLEVMGVPDLVADRVRDALDFHRKVSAEAFYYYYCYYYYYYYVYHYYYYYDYY
jgi:hypothetical protein